MIKQNKSNLKALGWTALAVGVLTIAMLAILRLPPTAFAHAAAQTTATPAVTATDTISGTGGISTTNACGDIIMSQMMTPTVPVTGTLVPDETPTAEVTPTATLTATAGMPPVKVLRIGEDIYPATLDPQHVSFVNEFEIVNLAYEGLVTVDAAGNVQPAAAEKYAFNADGTQLTFTLQPDLKRVDGTPLTSKDFAAALKRALDPCLGNSPYASILYQIHGTADLANLDIDTATPADLQKALDAVGISTPDYQTLTLTFDHPVGAYWLDIASLPIFFPTDPKTATNSVDWADIAGNHNGNGPYVILNLDEGNSITLAANPNYRLGPPKIDRIEFTYNTDSAAQLQAYKDGKLDVDASVTAELVPGILSDTLKSEFQQYESAQTYALSFNNTIHPFDDRIVRTAFSQALDRDGFVKDQLNGVGHVTTRWLPPGVPGSRPDKPGVPPYDPTAAVKTLVDNGYGTADGKVNCDKLGALKFTYADSPTNAQRATYITSQLQKVIGCPITTEAVNATQFTILTNDVTTNPQMSLQRWAEDYPHPQNWLSAYWSCGSFAIDFGYCNVYLDQLMNKADSATDFESAIKSYQAAEDLLISDVPGAFMYNPDNLQLVKPYVIGPTDNKSPRDAGWIGETGPVSTYDIDLSKVPDTYPKQ